jgi:hypothetical protein
VEAWFGPFRDSASLDARLVHGLHQMYHKHTNHFGCTRWDSKVTRLKWNLNSVRLEIVLLLMQDWWSVCVECVVGSEIVLEAPDGTPR